MEKFLRPERLDLDPASQSSSQEWEYWKNTFTNFLAANAGEQLTEELKLQLLINHISPKVYSFIRDCNSYTAAIVYLESVFVKPTNEIFARHRLATRRQLQHETVDEYLQALKLLGKDCKFKAVSAEENANECIRDAFITGLLSCPIRQRLLENITLKLDEAFSQA